MIHFKVDTGHFWSSRRVFISVLYDPDTQSICNYNCTKCIMLGGRMYVNNSWRLISITVTRWHKMFILLTNESVFSVTQILQVFLVDVCTASRSTDEWLIFAQAPGLILLWSVHWHQFVQYSVIKRCRCSTYVFSSSVEVLSVASWNATTKKLRVAPRQW